MTADDLDIDDIQRTLLCNADIPCGRLTMGDVWHDIKALALVAEVRRLRAENAALAAALAGLIDAASDHHHTECLLHDTRWGGVDTCDNLGVTPADSRRCPNCRLRDALAALEAAPARLAEVRRLRAENAELAAAVRALNDTVNELAILFEDHTGAPPHISTGVVEPQR